MNVGVIGSGQVAQALAGGFVALGHQVELGSRTPEKRGGSPEVVFDTLTHAVSNSWWTYPRSWASARVTRSCRSSRARPSVVAAAVLVVARFIPGGRTATTYAAGTLRMPWRRRFLPADALASLVWAAYASALGHFGGQAFADNLREPLLLAAGVALLVACAGELVRRAVLDRHAR